MRVPRHLLFHSFAVPTVLRYSVAVDQLLGSFAAMFLAAVKVVTPVSAPAQCVFTLPVHWAFPLG